MWLLYCNLMGIKPQCLAYDCVGKISYLGFWPGLQLHYYAFPLVVEGFAKCSRNANEAGKGAESSFTTICLNDATFQARGGKCYFLMESKWVEGLFTGGIACKLSLITLRPWSRLAPLSPRAGFRHEGGARQAIDYLRLAAAECLCLHKQPSVVYFLPDQVSGLSRRAIDFYGIIHHALANG